MHRAEKAWYYVSIALMVTASLTLIAVAAATKSGILTWP